MKEQNNNESNSILPELKESKKMLVIGYNSMIASRFLDLTGESRVVGFDYQNAKTKTKFPSEQLNIVTATADEIKNVFKEYLGEYVVNFVAQTNVDLAENVGDKDNPEGLTYKLNVGVVKKLADVCREFNMTLVHFSTDFVFDGKKGPYAEDDKTAAARSDVGWYGWTKKLAESELMSSQVNHLIVRTAYPYRASFEGKGDFVRNILAGFKSKDLYPMFVNQLLTPTYIDNLAKALDILIKNKKTGIWHVVDNTTLSAYDAARIIAQIFGFDPNLVPKGDLFDWQLKNGDRAKRPPSGGLKNDKLQKYMKDYDFQMQDFQNSLQSLKKQIQTQKEVS